MKIKQIINSLELRKIKKNLPIIKIGDTVCIGVLIKEGNKQRIQPYEGTVIAQNGNSIHKTITVRRIFQGIGVERIFPIHSFIIQNINILKRAKVRKAKLYYLRNRIGKKTRLKENFHSTKN